MLTHPKRGRRALRRKAVPRLQKIRRRDRLRAGHHGLEFIGSLQSLI